MVGVRWAEEGEEGQHGHKRAARGILVMPETSTSLWGGHEPTRVIIHTHKHQ